MKKRFPDPEKQAVQYSTVTPKRREHTKQAPPTAGSVPASKGWK